MSTVALTQSLHALTRPGGRSLKNFAKELYKSINEDDIFGRSAQLAYYFFFSLFPGFIFLSALLSVASAPGTALRANLMLHLPSLVPSQVFGLLQQTFNETAHPGGTLTLGALAALWSATVGMAAACDTLNAVHDVIESRPYWKVRLIALGLTMVTTLCFLCACVVLFSGDAVVRLAGPHLHWALLSLIKGAQWVLAFFFLTVIFAVTYFWAPDVKEGKWHWITPGATLGILLWALATVALRVYLHYFNSFSVTYGSLGAVIILLTWFYIAGFAMLMGAEINAAVENEAAKSGDPNAIAKGENAPETIQAQEATAPASS
jgi:membrane protein